MKVAISSAVREAKHICVTTLDNKLAPKQSSDNYSSAEHWWPGIPLHSLQQHVFSLDEEASRQKKHSMPSPYYKATEGLQFGETVFFILA